MAQVMRHVFAGVSLVNRLAEQFAVGVMERNVEQRTADQRAEVRHRRFQGAVELFQQPRQLFLNKGVADFHRMPVYIKSGPGRRQFHAEVHHGFLAVFK